VVTVYELGSFRLDTQGDLLFRGSDPLALGRRAIALLRVLVERPGAVVSKDELIEAAWPGQAVEESNLTVQIAALRRVLGREPGADRWIETMPRRGYRFVGPVVSGVQSGATEAPPQVDAAPDPATTPHPDAERRQITAMSCELIGTTRGSGGTDLEDRRVAFGAFHHCVAEVVRRHGGFIASHLGNTALVLFGYPTAHEDDAEVAVRAGLELCAAVRTLRPRADMTMRCRVGIATGMVIVGDAAGIDEGREPEIVGDTPGLAAQLQISAQPDMVSIEPATRRLIGNLFDCSDLDTIETGGGAEPMRRWRVAGERVVESRFEALRGSSLSPLIGRDEEIEVLLRRWTRAKAGDGQVVLVSGEPGIGKSRIAAALAERLHAEPYLRLRYFCSPHHQDSALSPFVDQLGRAARFARDDPPATRLEKLEAVLARAEPPEADVALLADLLSLPGSECHPVSNLSPQRRKEKTLEALVRQFEGLARRRPVVVVFEDAHWIDPTSRELLDLTIERLRSLPVLLIVTFRPEFQPPWVGQPQVTMLALNRLDRRDRMGLVEQIAGKALPEEVVAQIADRTDGVPLFVEELTKSVLESGLLREEANQYVLRGALPALAIPKTLHASLTARLDRSRSVRRVAQIGAAIGRDFSYELLGAVSRMPKDELQAGLADLVASELAFQRGIPPDAVYSFKHALVRDAAHDSLLRSARQQLHAQIAEALETYFPEVMENQPELLAQHFAEAGRVEQSVAYWSKAGHRSAARSATAEAVAQFRKALDQLALLPDNSQRQRQELEYRSALGAVLIAVKGHVAPETGQAYARARELWEELGSPTEFLNVPAGQSRYHLYRAEFDLAQRLAEDLLRLSRQRNDTAGLFLGDVYTGLNLMFTGRFAASRLRLEEARAVHDPMFEPWLTHQTGVNHHVNSQVYLGIVLLCLGYPEQAVRQGNAAIAEARSLGHLQSLVTSLTLLAFLLSEARDDTALGERLEELALAVAEQSFAYTADPIFRGWLEVKHGRITDGLPLLRGGVATVRARGSVLWRPYFFALLARACERAGQLEEATALLDEVLQIVEKTGECWFAAELHRHKGRLLLRQGHPEAAAGLYRNALSIAQEQEAKLWELRAAASLAQLRRDQGCHVEARDLLAPVYGWFTEGFDTPDLKEAKALLDELA
jgi:DNA-binding winged helix-turn-helix (wHTH) protein/predicted ATPase